MCGGDADEIRERTIHAEDVVRLVMNHDEVTDGVKDFDPVAVRFFHAREKTRIFKSDGGMSGDGAQELGIFDAGSRAAVCETKNTDQSTGRAGQADERAIEPSEGRGEFRPKELDSRGVDNVLVVLGDCGTQLLAEAAQQSFVVDLGTTADQECVEIRLQEKAEGNGASSEQVRSAASKVSPELGEMEDRAQFKSERDKRLSTATMLFGLIQIAGQLEGDGGLRREGAGAADVLVANLALFLQIQQAEHSEHAAVRSEQRDGQQLLDAEGGHEIEVGSRNRRGIFRAENFFSFESTGSNSFVQRNIGGLHLSVVDSPAYVEQIVFEQADEATAEAHEGDRPGHEGAHEMVETTRRSEFKRDLENFVKLLGLGPSHSVEFCVGDGDGSETGKG